MLLKWVNLVALVVGLVCFLVGAYLHRPTVLQIRDFLHPDFKNSMYWGSYIDAFACERHIPVELRKRYFIATMLMSIALVCASILMFQINDPVMKVVVFLVGIGAAGAMIDTTRRYLKSTRPR